MSDDGDLLAAIRLRAYFLWEQAGRPSGGDMAFWDEARRQIDAATDRPGATEPSRPG